MLGPVEEHAPMNHHRHGKIVASSDLKRIFYPAATSPGMTYHVTNILLALVYAQWETHGTIA